ncbi:MAG: CNNM domain-containing protein [Kiloniellales bacterium]|nr:CNNM domain-containing protein [Kiloniellales bacterium]
MTTPSTLDLLTWAGIVLCLSQAGMFSGLNLAVFCVGRMRLEIEATLGDPQALKVLALRRDPNLTLTTILWGNVAVNVLLTLLSDSVLTGVSAFLFSTFAITIFGEILPQAYCSNHAMRIVSALTPVLRAYGVLLYPLAKPSAAVLNRWLGRQGVRLYREREMRELIHKHFEAEGAEIQRLEGLGALNFLALDDLRVSEEGEILDPRSVISLPLENGLPVFPAIRATATDPFLKQIDRSGRKWIVVTDLSNEPQFVLNSDAFLRGALFAPASFRPLAHCHRPIIVRDPGRRLGDVIGLLKVHPDGPGDNVIDNDVILVWGREKRVITGADILGRLMSGIASVEAPAR